MTVIDSREVRDVLRALVLASTRQRELDPGGDSTINLWVACLAVSEAEPTDPPVEQAWPALLAHSRDWLRREDGPRPLPRPRAIPDDQECPLCGASPLEL
jgi:hypothetical protein